MEGDSYKDKGGRAEKALLSVAILIGLCIVPAYVYIGSILCKMDIGDSNLNWTIVPQDREYKEQYTRAKDDKTSKKNVSGAFPIPPFTGPYTIEQYNSSKEHNGEKNSWTNKFFCDSKISDAFLVVFTYALFVATVWLVVVTRRLWDAGERQIAVAKQSADAALKSAEVAEKALYGAEAPFLFIVLSPPDGTEDIIVVTDRGVTYPVGFTYSLHNYGRSPALIRETDVHFIATNGRPEPYPFPPPHNNILVSEIISAGGFSKATPIVHIACCLPPDGKMYRWASVICFGQVRYTDVSGNQYISNFCYAFDARSKQFYAIGGAAHNCRRKLNEEETRIAEARDTPPQVGPA
jgi:hypothetical protein